MSLWQRAQVQAVLPRKGGVVLGSAEAPAAPTWESLSALGEQIRHKLLQVRDRL